MSTVIKKNQDLKVSETTHELLRILKSFKHSKSYDALILSLCFEHLPDPLKYRIKRGYPVEYKKALDLHEVSDK